MMIAHEQQQQQQQQQSRQYQQQQQTSYQGFDMRNNNHDNIDDRYNHHAHFQQPQQHQQQRFYAQQQQPLSTPTAAVVPFSSSSPPPHVPVVPVARAAAVIGTNTATNVPVPGNYSPNNIVGKYLLMKRIGGGSFGDAYIAVNVSCLATEDHHNGGAVGGGVGGSSSAAALAARKKQEDRNMGLADADTVCIKLDTNSMDKEGIFEHEYRCMVRMRHEPGFPFPLDAGLDGIGRKYIAMRWLGPSLQSLMEVVMKGRPFSTKTILILGIQLLQRIRALHKIGYIHRDIKPENLLMGRPPHSSTRLLHLIDLGLVKRWRDPKTKRHIPWVDHKPMTGTPRFCSIATSSGYEQSRRDDIQSCIYAVVYMGKGSLPWQSLKAATKDEKYAMVLYLKRKIGVGELCSGLPSAFGNILTHSLQLQFEEEPPYEKYEEWLRSELKMIKATEEDEFDWTILYERGGISIVGNEKTGTGNALGGAAGHVGAGVGGAKAGGGGGGGGGAGGIGAGVGVGAIGGMGENDDEKDLYNPPIPAYARQQQERERAARAAAAAIL